MVAAAFSKALFSLSQLSPQTQDKVPDALHNTGSNKDTGKVSHATGSSVVPQFLQEGLPEKVEKVVPNALHDVSFTDIVPI